MSIARLVGSPAPTNYLCDALLWGVVRNPPDFGACQYHWKSDFHVLHGCTRMQQWAFHVSFARYCPFCTFCDLVFLCYN